LVFKGMKQTLLENKKWIIENGEWKVENE
jgi:hypothetical protein